MSYSTDPYPSLGLRTPEGTQSSEHGCEPFEYGPNHFETQVASDTLVGLSNPRFDIDIGQTHAFGPELRLSPNFDTDVREVMASLRSIL